MASTVVLLMAPPRCSAKTRMLLVIDHFLRVLAAFLAAAERSAFERFATAAFAWRESAFFVAAVRGSRFSAVFVAFDRFADFFFADAPFFTSRLACCRVFSFAFPFSGGGSF